MNLTTNGQYPGTVLSVGIALNRYRPMGLNTCRLELHQLQKLNMIHKRMAHFFPGRFLDYTTRSHSFVSTYSQPAWWHALKSLYHMADEEDLFSVDWYLLGMADRWDVRNPDGWREKIPETELFLRRLPVALYGFCDQCDNDDIMQYPPLHLMRGLLSLEWRTHHGSAAAIIDEYDLGEAIKQQAREASLWEMWHRLEQLEQEDDLTDEALIRWLPSLAHYAISDTGNPILDRHYEWHDADPRWGGSTFSPLSFSISYPCGAHEYFPWTWHPDCVNEAHHLWKIAQRVMKAADQLTKWCEQSDINFIRFARFVITGEGKDELKNQLGQIRTE